MNRRRNFRAQLLRSSDLPSNHPPKAMRPTGTYHSTRCWSEPLTARAHCKMRALSERPHTLPLSPPPPVLGTPTTSRPSSHTMSSQLRAFGSSRQNGAGGFNFRGAAGPSVRGAAGSQHRGATGSHARGAADSGSRSTVGSGSRGGASGSASLYPVAQNPRYTAGSAAPKRRHSSAGGSRGSSSQPRRLSANKENTTSPIEDALQSLRVSAGSVLISLLFCDDLDAFLNV